MARDAPNRLEATRAYSPEASGVRDQRFNSKETGWLKPLGPWMQRSAAPETCHASSVSVPRGRVARLDVKFVMLGGWMSLLISSKMAS